MNAPEKIPARSDLLIGDIRIGQDGHGRFCLNDLHRAAIADGTENQHEAVIKLVRKYRGDLEEFGSLRFEIGVMRKDRRGGGQGEIATLNEQQSTLLLTYMRNSQIVRGFKKALVKAFWELKNREGAGPKVPKTLSEALRLAVDLETQREAAIQKAVREAAR